jgi:hypothetical protein
MLVPHGLGTARRFRARRRSGFSRAAVMMNLAQPTLSRQIALLAGLCNACASAFRAP